jgi:glycosyltransferase involved in cell wall biosynthesis
MSSPTPKVSLGIPVYNGERYLEEALESLLAQSFEDFEIVISDNASTDATEEICRTFARNDDRISYFRSERNRGVLHNFNEVFRRSQGEYFKWAASDDVCGRDYLLYAVQKLDEDPSVVLVWAKTVGIDEQGARVRLPFEVSDLNSSSSVYSPHPVVRLSRLLRNIWWVDGPFYGVIRSDALARTRWLHPPHPSGDEILLVELSLKGRFYEIPKELFFTRVHSGKTSKRHSTLKARAALVGDKPSGKGAFDRLRAFRVYPERIAMYALVIWDSRLSGRQKVLCFIEVLRAMASWVILRIRQLASGSSPWRETPSGRQV